MIALICNYSEANLYKSMPRLVVPDGIDTSHHISNVMLYIVYQTTA